MSIEIKSINDILILKCSETDEFQNIINELEKLLDQPIFQQDGYYPKAFFDFQCRQLKNDEMNQLIELVIRKKKVLFEGVSLPQKIHQIEINKKTIRSGEEIHVYHETLFLGKINAGSYIYCYKDAYFLNEVRGKIMTLHHNVKIYGHHFTNAQIVMNNKVLHDVSTRTLTTFFDDGQDIRFIKEEQNYGENHRFNFR